jgi:hypothetical protein
MVNTRTLDRVVACAPRDTPERAFRTGEKPAINAIMTRLLEQAVATVSALPDDEQDELARVLLQLAGIEQPPYILTPEEKADIDASMTEAERGEFATDDEIRAIWAKHGR